MKLTIIIPTHNRPILLAKSLKEAKTDDAEILVIENGSTESNIKKYRLLEKKFPDVAFYYLKEGNLPAARQFGISKSKGEYIFHLDDDDLLTRDFKEYIASADLKENIYRFPIERREKISLPNWGKKYNKKWAYQSPQVSTWLIKRKFYGEFKIKFDSKFQMFEDQIFSAQVHRTKTKQYLVSVISIKYDFFGNSSSFTRGVKRSLSSDIKYLDKIGADDYMGRAIIISALYAIINFSIEGIYEINHENTKIINDTYKKVKKNKFIWMKKKIKNFINSNS